MPTRPTSKECLSSSNRIGYTLLLEIEKPFIFEQKYLKSIGSLTFNMSSVSLRAVSLSPSPKSNIEFGNDLEYV